jgi:hypothetical protein
MEYFVLLLGSFLFGGMLLFSVGFGTLSFKFLDPSVARNFIRKTFPFFYNYVLFVSALIFLLGFSISKTIAFLAFVVFVTTFLTSKILMPAINKAADSQQNRSFVFLHTLSVAITISHIIMCAFILYLISV